VRNGRTKSPEKKEPQIEDMLLTNLAPPKKATSSTRMQKIIEEMTDSETSGTVERHSSNLAEFLQKTKSALKGTSKNVLDVLPEAQPGEFSSSESAMIESSLSEESSESSSDSDK
jgi:hypothetical protein